MRLRSLLFNIAVWVALSGCAHPTAPAAPPSSAGSLGAPVLGGEVAHPGRTSGWVDTKLYFGLGPADHPEKGISEAQWRDFLDKEVTPRFPDGLSVVDVYGQWQGHWQGQKDPAPERLRSKLLIVDYQDSPENRNKIEAIRSAWKRQTRGLTVLG